jgi:hypothetical protein
MYTGDVYNIHRKCIFTLAYSIYSDIRGKEKKLWSVRTPKTHTLLTTNEKTRLKNQELYREVGLSEFESESLAPKAKRMDQATPQALTYTV